MSTEQTIRDFVDRFYAAINQMLNGRGEPMEPLWSHGPEATVMHPDGTREMGWEEVRGAFRGWAAAVKDGRIEPREVAIRLVTSDVAVVTAHETGRGTIAGQAVEVDARATLVLRREGGGWTAVHHHVDADPKIRALAASARATLDLSGASIGSPEPALP
jgi:ketosteroid isomerase-like protein